jgi:hypothetical protein
MEIIESRSIDFQGGMTGCKVLSGTSANTGGFQAFVINADAVVSVVLDKSGNDITSALGLTSITITKGMLISMPKGDYFSSITLTSGSVIGYLI